MIREREREKKRVKYVLRVYVLVEKFFFTFSFVNANTVIRFRDVDIPLKTQKRIDDKCLIQEIRDKDLNSSMLDAYQQVTFSSKKKKRRVYVREIMMIIMMSFENVNVGSRSKRMNFNPFCSSNQQLI